MDPRTFHKLVKNYEILLDNNLVYYMYVVYREFGLYYVPDGLKRSIKSYVFSKKVRYGLHNKKNYSAHHILPKYFFPGRMYDSDLGVPLPKNIHVELHMEYPNEMLIMDPISPILEVISQNSK